MLPELLYRANSLKLLKILGSTVEAEGERNELSISLCFNSKVSVEMCDVGFNRCSMLEQTCLAKPLISRIYCSWYQPENKSSIKQSASPVFIALKQQPQHNLWIWVRYCQFLLWKMRRECSPVICLRSARVFLLLAQQIAQTALHIPERFGGQRDILQAGEFPEAENLACHRRSTNLFAVLHRDRAVLQRPRFLMNRHNHNVILHADITETRAPGKGRLLGIGQAVHHRRKTSKKQQQHARNRRHVCVKWNFFFE